MQVFLLFCKLYATSNSGEYDNCGTRLQPQPAEGYKVIDNKPTKIFIIDDDSCDSGSTCSSVENQSHKLSNEKIGNVCNEFYVHIDKKDEVTIDQRASRNVNKVAKKYNQQASCKVKPLSEGNLRSTNSRQEMEGENVTENDEKFRHELKRNEYEYDKTSKKNLFLLKDYAVPVDSIAAIKCTTYSKPYENCDVIIKNNQSKEAQTVKSNIGELIYAEISEIYDGSNRLENHSYNNDINVIDHLHSHDICQPNEKEIKIYEYGSKTEINVDMIYKECKNYIENSLTDIGVIKTENIFNEIEIIEDKAERDDFLQQKSAENKKTEELIRFIVYNSCLEDEKLDDYTCLFTINNNDLTIYDNIMKKIETYQNILGKTEHVSSNGETVYFAYKFRTKNNYEKMQKPIKTIDEHHENNSTKTVAIKRAQKINVIYEKNDVITVLLTIKNTPYQYNELKLARYEIDKKEYNIYYFYKETSMVKKTKELEYCCLQKNHNILKEYFGQYTFLLNNNALKKQILKMPNKLAQFEWIPILLCFFKNNVICNIFKDTKHNYDDIIQKCKRLEEFYRYNIIAECIEYSDLQKYCRISICVIQDFTKKLEKYLNKESKQIKIRKSYKKYVIKLKNEVEKIDKIKNFESTINKFMILHILMYKIVYKFISDSKTINFIVNTLNNYAINEIEEYKYVEISSDTNIEIPNINIIDLNAMSVDKIYKNKSIDIFTRFFAKKIQLLYQKDTHERFFTFMNDLMLKCTMIKNYQNNYNLSPNNVKVIESEACKLVCTFLKKTKTCFAKTINEINYFEFQFAFLYHFMQKIDRKKRIHNALPKHLASIGCFDVKLKDLNLSKQIENNKNIFYYSNKVLNNFENYLTEKYGSCYGTILYKSIIEKNKDLEIRKIDDYYKIYKKTQSVSKTMK